MRQTLSLDALGDQSLRAEMCIRDRFSSEDGFLEQELPFTFDGVELLEKYKDAQ